jgi:hypothetical protein
MLCWTPPVSLADGLCSENDAGPGKSNSANGAKSQFFIDVFYFPALTVPMAINLYAGAMIASAVRAK